MLNAVSTVVTESPLRLSAAALGHTRGHVVGTFHVLVRIVIWLVVVHALVLIVVIVYALVLIVVIVHALVLIVVIVLSLVVAHVVTLVASVLPGV